MHSYNGVEVSIETLIEMMSYENFHIGNDNEIFIDDSMLSTSDRLKLFKTDKKTLSFMKTDDPVFTMFLHTVLPESFHLPYGQYAPDFSFESIKRIIAKTYEPFKLNVSRTCPSTLANVIEWLFDKDDDERLLMFILSCMYAGVSRDISNDLIDQVCKKLAARILNIIKHSTAYGTMPDIFYQDMKTWMLEIPYGLKDEERFSDWDTLANKKFPDVREIFYSSSVGKKHLKKIKLKIA